MYLGPNGSPGSLGIDDRSSFKLLPVGMQSCTLVRLPARREGPHDQLCLQLGEVLCHLVAVWPPEPLTPEMAQQALDEGQLSLLRGPVQTPAHVAPKGSETILSALHKVEPDAAIARQSRAK